MRPLSTWCPIVIGLLVVCPMISGRALAESNSDGVRMIRMTEMVKAAIIIRLTPIHPSVTFASSAVSQSPSPRDV